MFDFYLVFFSINSHLPAGGQEASWRVEVHQIIVLKPQRAEAYEKT